MRSRHTSKRLPSKLLIILSGEETSLPEAEARALILTYDEGAKFSLLEPRILLTETSANPDVIARRIAYARRVGLSLPPGRLDRETRRMIEKGSYRLRNFRLGKIKPDHSIGDAVLAQLHGRVDLEHPTYELSVIHGSRIHLLLSRPEIMSQDWVVRKPRSRAFFHPSAIFPKLSRALVNLSGVREGGILLDPFAGTGSILLEAFIVGALPVGIDVSSRMVRGAVANERRYGQSWLGMVRAEMPSSPVRTADGIVTDAPYGRAASTFGTDAEKVVENLLRISVDVLQKGRSLVMMHSSRARVRKVSEFTITGEHRLYIHRNLTRVISVLRRR